MAEKTYDAIVIGAGPGGYPAAIKLGQLGLKVLCVEKEYWGGVCLNWGCIPSKALIHAAGLYDKMKNAETMGISVSKVAVDVAQMQEWKGGIVKKLTGGVQSLIKGNGGELLFGAAKLVSKDTVEVTKEDGSKERVKAKLGIVVATGAQMIQIPGFEPDGETILTARHAVGLTEVPKSMVLIGGGVIGLELGMVYQKLGTKVTVVEMMDQLLPGTDKDLVKVVEKHLMKRKDNPAEVLLKAKAKSVEKKKKGGAKVTVEHEGKDKTFEVDKVLVAVGFKPNSKDLGLEEVGVKLDERGHILVDKQMKTNVPGIWAVGDVTGAPYLAHKATKEGEIAAEVIAGHKAAADWRAMPAAIFTEPEIATVGLTETEAKKQGKDVEIGKFPFSILGKAMAINEPDGFVKVIIDPKDHQTLGVAVVGAEASTLISEAALAMEMCAYAEDVMLTVHPHPTMGEATMEAFAHSIGQAVHTMNKKKKK